MKAKSTVFSPLEVKSNPPIFGDPVLSSAFASLPTQMKSFEESDTSVNDVQQHNLQLSLPSNAKMTIHTRVKADFTCSQVSRSMTSSVARSDWVKSPGTSSTWEHKWEVSLSTRRFGFFFTYVLNVYRADKKAHVSWSWDLLSVFQFCWSIQTSAGVWSCSADSLRSGTPFFHPEQTRNHLGR